MLSHYFKVSASVVLAATFSISAVARSVNDLSKDDSRKSRLLSVVLDENDTPVCMATDQKDIPSELPECTGDDLKLTKLYSSPVQVANTAFAVAVGASCIAGAGIGLYFERFSDSSLEKNVMSYVGTGVAAALVPVLDYLTTSPYIAASEGAVVGALVPGIAMGAGYLICNLGARKVYSLYFN